MGAAKTELAAAERCWAKAPAEPAAAHVTGAVLDVGQIEGLGLRPVVGNVVEIFGVGGDLLEEAPSGLDVGQILLTLILAPARRDQVVCVPDAFQGAMAERQLELADETTRAEGGELLAQSGDLLLDFRRSLAGLMMGRRETAISPRNPCC
jgi:hypothetical protein